MAKAKAEAKAMTDRPISAKDSIKMYLHCRECLKELGMDGTPKPGTRPGPRARARCVPPASGAGAEVSDLDAHRGATMYSYTYWYSRGYRAGWEGRQ